MDASSLILHVLAHVFPKQAFVFLRSKWVAKQIHIDFKARDAFVNYI